MVLDNLYENMEVNSSNYIKLKLEKFADSIDSQNQNLLMTDLMLRYSELSKSFEKKNEQLLEHRKTLEKYNNHLEELVNEKVEEISESQMATIFALVKLAESRDDDTGAHVERTADLCKLMATYLRKFPKYRDLVDDEYIDNIYKASPLHDIGKVGISDNILLKRGKLTNEEFEIMKTHVEIGYNTLREVHSAYKGNAFLLMGMDITRNHHEKWDGTGYPRGLKGEDIPLAGRIMAIIDVYDALRSKRVYKDAYSQEKSLKIISRERGKHFDPTLVDVFLTNCIEFNRVYNLNHPDV